MARLQITSAVHANPLGVPLFLCALLALPRTAIGFARAEALADAFLPLRPAPLAAMMAVSALLTWGARLLGLFIA